MGCDLCGYCEFCHSPEAELLERSRPARNQTVQDLRAQAWGGIFRGQLHGINYEIRPEGSYTFEVAVNGLIVEAKTICVLALARQMLGSSA